MKDNNIITKRNSRGIQYKVRLDKRRYFFPDEWLDFISIIKNRTHRFFFTTLLFTGARAMEALNLRHKDIDLERGTVNFETVKQRKAKKNFYAIGKQRSFFVASNFFKEYKSYIRGRSINPEDYIFLNNEELPQDYSKLPNEEKREFFLKVYVNYSQIFKRQMKKSKIEDPYNFSLHNIRKTFGNWMRTFNIEMAELCYRMGHDINTYLLHYGSSLIFTESERRKINKILGDVK